MKAKTRKSKRTTKGKNRKKGKHAVNKDNAKSAFEDLLAEDDEFLQGYLNLLGRNQGALKRKND